MMDGFEISHNILILIFIEKKNVFMRNFPWETRLSNNILHKLQNPIISHLSNNKVSAYADNFFFYKAAG